MYHDDPSKFFQELFEEEAGNLKEDDPLQRVVCGEFPQLCRNFDETLIQESWSWRNVHSSRELAFAIIDPKGEIDRKALYRVVFLLEENMYSLGPERHHDTLRQKHLVSILKSFYEKQEFSYALKRISRPFGHPGADRLIRESLRLPETTSISDCEARRATFSALLTYLRQNVGSCFATAPAIIIQKEQPLQFLSDIGQLLGTGRLKRIIEGKEYVVPLSMSWGMGDLLRPIYLSALGKDPLASLALSPGLQSAFEASGLIEKKGGSEECAKILKESFPHVSQEDPLLLITADQIIKSALLKKYHLSEKDVSDFQERSLQGPWSELMIQAPAAAGSKALSVGRYLKTYEAAKEAFKSLTDHALLKAWEFTLASLSESKADFTKWNLYTSLGIRPEERFGIGESIYEKIQEKIALINDEIAEYQSHYDHLFAQTKYLEGRIAHSATERELGWIQAEYQIRRHEINRAISERDEAYEKGRKLQNLYPKLIEFLGEKISNYFQEVYDVEMHDITTNYYDDSPAGFRLMYKHGRGNTALWTMVNSAAEYIQHLTAFFVAMELELHQLPEIKGIHREVSDLITTTISTIKRPEFLEHSLKRLAHAYREPVVQNPTANLTRVKRKPWSYISGGTMGTLVSCYWNRTQHPTETKRWIEEGKEYLAFLIDTFKGLPLSIQKMYQSDPEKSLLAFSPTHAFTCKPGWSLFRKAWESDVYAYTWIRDHWMGAQKKFLDTIVLEHRMMERIVDELLHIVPLSYRPFAAHLLKNFTYRMTPPQLRHFVIKTLSYEKWLPPHHLDLISEEMDSILYRSLPLFFDHQLGGKLVELFDAIDEITPQLRDRVLQLIPLAEEKIGKYQVLTAKNLRDIAKALLIAALKKTRAPLDYHNLILQAMQRQGLCYPEPFLFGDTNWVKNAFGFVLNPGNESLELWRFDFSGSEGRPINIWKRYLNGKERIDWGLYTNPHQYG
jgi:hypothetical protein